MDEATGAMAAAIGDRVRHRRQARGWTLDHLADIAGMSRRMVVNVEQGAANPSVGTLLRISDALGVGLPELVAPPQPKTVTVTRRGEGPVLWTSPNGGRAVLVAGTSSPHVHELWDWTLGPGDHYASKAHSRGTRELVHVLKGRVRISAADRTVALGSGDAAAFAGDVAHSYANVGAGPARFSLAVLEPGVGGHQRPEGSDV